MTIKWHKGIEFEQITPQPGWLQHNFNQIWTDTQSLLAELAAHFKDNQIAPSDLISV
jgi:glycerol kinase